MLPTRSASSKRVIRCENIREIIYSGSPSLVSSHSIDTRYNYQKNMKLYVCSSSFYWSKILHFLKGLGTDERFLGVSWSQKIPPS
jgi:hypothetical protein